MGDINVFSRTEDIKVAPARQKINVFNMPHEPEILIQPAGIKLANSYPANWESGMWLGGGDQHLWDFRLPSDMKIGDHALITYYGSIGDNTTGAAGWMMRLWLDGLDTKATIYNYGDASNGTTTKRAAFKGEVDVLMESASSAYIWHRLCLARYLVPGTSQIVTTDGAYHTLAVCKNTAQNIPGIGIRITGQCYGGTSPGSSMHVRGLTLEHLLAP